jgi:hypothetical protein
MKIYLHHEFVGDEGSSQQIPETEALLSMFVRFFRALKAPVYQMVPFKPAQLRLHLITMVYRHEMDHYLSCNRYGYLHLLSNDRRTHLFHPKAKSVSPSCHRTAKADGDNAICLPISVDTPFIHDSNYQSGQLTSMFIRTWFFSCWLVSKVNRRYAVVSRAHSGAFS